jgi:hypothetical protein
LQKIIRNGIYGIYWNRQSRWFLFCRWEWLCSRSRSARILYNLRYFPIRLKVICSNFCIFQENNNERKLTIKLKKTRKRFAYDCLVLHLETSRIKSNGNSYISCDSPIEQTDSQRC